MKASQLVGIVLLLISASCSQREAVAPGESKANPTERPPEASVSKVTAASSATPTTPESPVAPPAQSVAAGALAALPAVTAPEPPTPTPPPLPKAEVATNASGKSLWRALDRVVNQATNLGVRAPGGPSSNTAGSLSVADLSSDQITRGLKEALAKGLDHAIGQLGKDGGFLTNVNVRIPMPEKLQMVETLLRRAGQDKLADDFVATMNHAAEKAVPAAASVFADSLKQMSVQDAQGILKGPNDAATEYFRRTAGAQLQEKFRPIVAQATAQSGVTAAYKKLMDRASFASPFFKKESLDVDDYVTAKASDGLFKMVADEEKKIRENPLARTTDLLRSVFGALGK